MFWKRMTATAGWAGLVSGTFAAIGFWVLSDDVTHVIPLGGQGGAFVAAGLAFVVDIAVSIVVTMGTQSKDDEELKGLVYSLTPKKDFHDDSEVLAWWQQPTKLAGVSLVMVIVLNLLFL
jgi:SSS family solute:Na+ symporter